MKNKILLTTAMALIGLFTFSITAEAQRGCRGNNRHNHVTFQRGNRVVVWHNNYNQCNSSWGYGNSFRNNMCVHMRNIYRGGRFGRAIVRCNHRGCGMFGTSFRNGRFYNNHRGNANINRRGNRGGRFNQGGGRGNRGRYNQGGGRGNSQRNGKGRNNRNGRGRG